MKKAAAKHHAPAVGNARVTIIGGGFFHCTPDWNRDKGTHQFGLQFAFFLPVRGSAWMETAEGKCRLEPGNVYFIPGYHLIRRGCEKEMLVYWVNFVSESLYLHYRLIQVRGIHSWPLTATPWAERVFARFEDYFEDAETPSGHVRKDPPEGLSIKIEGSVMALLGVVIERTEANSKPDGAAELERLRAAIDFMDARYLNNPPLAEIAGRARLSPSYFSRLFTNAMGMTPFRYMDNRRLDHAEKLLRDRRLGIAEVAKLVGYENAFYFSRSFHRRFGVAPSRFRLIP